jgi:hypothetical protein
MVGHLPQLSSTAHQQTSLRHNSSSLPSRIPAHGHFLGVRPDTAQGDQCTQGAAGADTDQLPRRSAGNVRACVTDERTLRRRRRRNRLGADSFGSRSGPSQGVRCHGSDGPACGAPAPNAVPDDGSDGTDAGTTGRRSGRPACSSPAGEPLRRLPASETGCGCRCARRRSGDNRQQPHRGCAGASLGQDQRPGCSNGGRNRTPTALQITSDRRHWETNVHGLRSQ